MGLFEAKGDALDALNRLATEGVPEAQTWLKVLHDIAPTPSSVEPELAALEADPFVWGDVRETFAPYIKNGETALCVRAVSDSEALFAADIMKLYAPIEVRVLRDGERLGKPLLMPDPGPASAA
jgi:hypothetical protein